MMTQTTTIHERTTSLPKQGDASADSPVVSGVKVLGIESKNGRKYPIEVMRKALKQYEGAIVNIDHPAGSEPRSYEDRFGRLTNARMEADGIYADLAYNPKHPLAEGFQWWVKNDPKAIGLSHNAQAKTKMNQEGVEEIEEIVKVDSVDLVAEPATTAGLMECVIKAKRISERCWDGYEPTPGKEPYSNDSCRKEKLGEAKMKESPKVPDDEVRPLFHKVLVFQNSLKKLKSAPEDFRNLEKAMYAIFDKAGPKTKTKLNGFYNKIATSFPTEGALNRLDAVTKELLDFLNKVTNIEESKPRKKLNVTEAKKRKAFKRMLVSEAIKEILTIRKGV